MITLSIVKTRIYSDQTQQSVNILHSPIGKEDSSS